MTPAISSATYTLSSLAVSLFTTTAYSTRIHGSPAICNLLFSTGLVITTNSIIQKIKSRSAAKPNLHVLTSEMSRRTGRDLQRSKRKGL